MIAILIKTWMREGCIEKLVASIDTHLKLPYRFYIADELPVSQSRLDLYDQLEKKGHFIYIYQTGSPVAVTVARNFLLDNIGEEKYLLRLDDDFLFDYRTRIDSMIDVLESNERIGAVADTEIQVRSAKGIASNQISDAQGYVVLAKNSLIKVKVPIDSWFWLKTPTTVRYAYADFTRNMLLLKVEAAKDVRWNDNLQIHGEHIDFMLRLKEKAWLLAFTPDSVHLHDDPPPVKQDRRYRNARESVDSVRKMNTNLINVWGVERVLSVKMPGYTMKMGVIDAIKRRLKRLVRFWA